MNSTEQLLTFLMTDVEGSTRAWEDAPDAMRAAMARHDELLEAHVNAAGGRLLRERGEGDSTFSVFEDPGAALAAAVSAQRAIENEPWPAPVTIRVRMAVHTGMATERDADFYGASVNRCARLRATAHGGQIVVSGTALDHLDGALPDEVKILDLGQHRLRDLTDPERIAQVLHPDLRASFPPLISLETRPHNLPAQPTALIGRDDEVAKLWHLSSTAGVRLLTLLGPGGIGKTRLAVQVAAESVSRFPGGAWFVDLSNVTEPDGVELAIASALRVPEAPGIGPRQSLIDHLKSTAETLLVLDNFEQVLDAAYLVAELLTSAAGLQVIVTSRQALGLRGERRFEVPPLRCVEEGDPPPPAVVADYAAVALLVERARDFDHDFCVTTDNAADLAALCTALDGLPLALELAAPKVVEMGPERFRAGLDDRLAALAPGARDMPDRHRSLEAAIAWSHDLLSEPARAQLARLAIFAGGWDAPAAAAIGSTDEPTELVAANLVRQTITPDGPRWSMLALIRDFARRRLDEAPERLDVARRHTRYFAALVDTATEGLTGPSRKAAMAQLDRERDNIDAALELSARDDETAGLDLAIAGHLARYWIARGALNEGIRRLERALERSTATVGADRARALNGLGSLVAMQGDLERGATLHTEAADVARAANQPKLETSARLRFARLTIALGRATDARQAIAEALDLADAHGDKGGRADAMATLARLDLDGGDLLTARAGFQAAVELMDAVSDRDAQANLLNDLALVEVLMGDAEACRRHTERAMAIWAELDDKAGMAQCEVMLGNAAYVVTDLDGAEQHWNRALTIGRANGDHATVLVALNNLAEIDTIHGRLDRARPALEEAIAMLVSQGERTRVGQAVCNLATVEILAGQFDLAATLLDQAEAAASAVDDAVGLANVASNRSWLALARGDTAGAAAADASAYGIRVRIGDGPGLVRSHLRAGWTAMLAGDTAAARDAFEAARAAAADMDAKLDEAEAHAGLGWVAVAKGDLDAASAHLERASHDARTLGAAWVGLLALAGEADLAYAAADHELAGELAGELRAQRAALGLCAAATGGERDYDVPAQA